MKYDTHKFLCTESKTLVEHTVKKVRDLALPASVLFSKFGSEEVLPLTFTLQVIKLFPTISACQVAQRGLSDPCLSESDRLRLKKVLARTRDAKLFMEQNAGKYDPLCSYFAQSILIDKLAPVTQYLESNEPCIPIALILHDLEYLTKLEYVVEYNLEDYHLVWLKDFGQEAYDRIVDGIDSSRNHYREKLIIPLDVFSDVGKLNLPLSLQFALTKSLAEEKVLNNYSSIAKFENELSQVVKMLEPFARKYPCLKGIPFHIYRETLLKFYSRTPSEICQEFGPETICIPHNPKQQKLSLISFQYN